MSLICRDSRLQLRRMIQTTVSDLTVVEFLVAAALERYQASWDQLIETWFDRERFKAVNAELDEIRKLAAALPQLSVDMVQVIMRHAQLLRALVRAAGSQRAAQVTALRHKHRAAVEAIRGKCVRFLPRRATKPVAPVPQHSTAGSDAALALRAGDWTQLNFKDVQMAYSSILGAEVAPTVPSGRDADALGPSDSSDSGSDAHGTAEVHADSDAAGTGERGVVAGADGREGGDILPDRVVNLREGEVLPQDEVSEMTDLDADADEDVDAGSSPA
jgi:hypothetical protein